MKIGFLRKVVVTATIFITLFQIEAKETFKIEKIEPPYWWVGMKNDSLQLLVTGENVSEATVSIEGTGMRLIDQINLDSPNYKILNFVIPENTKPGTQKLIFSYKKEKVSIDYELKAREAGASEITGFDAGDVLYLIMPDRFAMSENTKADTSTLRFSSSNDRNNPNARHGGNIKGITEHLDYIDSLGVTAIWVCPILENDMPGGSYHGYATTDYYRVDPRFGTNEEWEELINEAHKRGIKVVMDMIFNHSGITHPWKNDMPTNDWYNHPQADVMTNFRLTTLHDPYVSEHDKDRTVNGWFVYGMPDLNQNNPYLLKYLTQNSIWWIESSKINGIRMDTYPYADMKAMGKWIDDVMKEYPNFNIVGECWYGNEAGSAFWQNGNKINPEGTNLETVMDFKFITDGDKFFNQETTPWEGLNYLYDHLSHDFLFPNPQKILTFLDNHDSDRFLKEYPDSLDNWKQAMTFLLTSRGIPQIYYGTEILMNGTKEKSDGNIRKDFPGGFPGDSISNFTAEGRNALQNEAWDFLSQLLQWRKGDANEVIAKGSLKHFMPINGIYAYERRLGDKKIIVILNGTSSPIEVDSSIYKEIMLPGDEFNEIITGQRHILGEEIFLNPREIKVLQNF